LQGLARIIHRASELNNSMTAKYLELVEEIIKLEADIEVSDLDDEIKSKLKSLLEGIKAGILEDCSEVNVFKRI